MSEESVKRSWRTIINSYVHLRIEIENQSIEIGKGKQFNLVSVEGIESADVDISAEASAQYDGDVRTGIRLASRIITVEADYTDIESVQQTRERLIHFMHPKKTCKLLVDYMGVQRTIEGTIRSFKCNRENIYEPLPVLIILDCPDPYFKDATGFSHNMATEIPLFTVPFAVPKGKPFTLSSRAFRQELTLINDGARESGFVVTFKACGVVDVPTLTNLVTEEFIKVPITMQANDELTINTNRGNKRVEHNGENINHLMDRESTFFHLALGDNTLKYTAESGYSNLDVYLYWYPEYLGV